MTHTIRQAFPPKPEIINLNASWCSFDNEPSSSPKLFHLSRTFTLLPRATLDRKKKPLLELPDLRETAVCASIFFTARDHASYIDGGGRGRNLASSGADVTERNWRCKRFGKSQGERGEVPRCTSGREYVIITYAYYGKRGCVMV